MTIKTIFKSHFKIKKNFNKDKKKAVFVKNMVLFFLFTKIFFANCTTSIMFQRIKANQLNILKAPSRHKKFFHQICVELFVVKVYYYYDCTHPIALVSFPNFFKKMDGIFLKVGSNTLTRTKFLVEGNFNIVDLL